jgi:alkanesulfonate monooxygenase SsuD/methylene tetrahydromethanopterin reductase-like flavin-dependent oxidoreductase (luciferase family)
VKFYHFSEMPYPYVGSELDEQYRGMRTFLPNRIYDPALGYELYQRYLDEYEMADELGLHLMVNEHHQSATCLQVSATMSAASMVNRTTRGRVILLGIPLPHRDNPVHVAEEVAYLDAISGGRIECGFVRGTAVETYPSNQNPVHNQDMFYESHDLIKEAWTRSDVFSWEGRFYNYRYVNVWPRSYQQPHPPIWITASAPPLIRWTAEHNYNLAFLVGRQEDTTNIFRIYRRAADEYGLPEPGPEKFGSMVLCYVAPTADKARQMGEKLMWYFTTMNPRQKGRLAPGYLSPSKSVDLLRGKLGSVRALGLDGMVDAGVILLGTPDTVINQIERLYETTGVGNMFLMMHAGEMTSNEVRDGMVLFSSEVMPAVSSLGEKWEDEDISWRVANDKTPVGNTLASSVS